MKFWFYDYATEILVLAAVVVVAVVVFVIVKLRKK